LGNAHLRFPHIGIAYFRKFDCALSNRTIKASFQPNGIHPSFEGAILLAIDRGCLLLLL
jgi:hypothetical protein